MKLRKEMNLFLLALAPWIIVCNEEGKYSFTDDKGVPMVVDSPTKQEARDRMEILKRWIEAGRPTKAHDWKPCPEEGKK
jgi:hypothetical protein